jgi:hypothetical protein
MMPSATPIGARERGNYSGDSDERDYSQPRNFSDALRRGDANTERRDAVGGTIGALSQSTLSQSIDTQFCALDLPATARAVAGARRWSHALGIDQLRRQQRHRTGPRWDRKRGFGRQWLGRQWLGRQWLGRQWLGRQWLGRQWLGRQWLGGSGVAGHCGCNARPHAVLHQHRILQLRLRRAVSRDAAGGGHAVQRGFARLLLLPSDCVFARCFTLLQGALGEHARILRQLDTS